MHDSTNNSSLYTQLHIGMLQKSKKGYKIVAFINNVTNTFQLWQSRHKLYKSVEQQMQMSKYFLVSMPQIFTQQAEIHKRCMKTANNYICAFSYWGQAKQNCQANQDWIKLYQIYYQNKLVSPKDVDC